MKLILIITLLFFASITNSLAQANVLDELTYYMWKSESNFKEQNIPKLKKIELKILDDSTATTPVVCIVERNFTIRYPEMNQINLYKYTFDKSQNILTIVLRDKKYNFKVSNVISESSMLLTRIK